MLGAFRAKVEEPDAVEHRVEGEHLIRLHRHRAIQPTDGQLRDDPIDGAFQGRCVGFGVRGRDGVKIQRPLDGRQRRRAGSQRDMESLQVEAEAEAAKGRGVVR